MLATASSFAEAHDSSLPPSALIRSVTMTDIVRLPGLMDDSAILADAATHVEKPPTHGAKPPTPVGTADAGASGAVRSHTQSAPAPQRVLAFSQAAGLKSLLMPTVAQPKDPRREHLRRQAALRRQQVLERISATRVLIVGGVVAATCGLAGCIDASARTRSNSTTSGTGASFARPVRPATAATPTARAATPVALAITAARGNSAARETTAAARAAPAAAPATRRACSAADRPRARPRAGSGASREAPDVAHGRCSGDTRPRRVPALGRPGGCGRHASAPACRQRSRTSNARSPRSTWAARASATTLSSRC